MGGGLDADGYVLPDVSLGFVRPPYDSVLPATARVVRDDFGNRLHSTYLYGSVVRGTAVPGRSDLDITVVLIDEPDADDRQAATRVESRLAEWFPFLFDARVEFTHVIEVRSASQRYGWQFFIRDFCVCIDGEDLRPSLPRTKPGPEAAFGLHDDFPERLARARENLGSSSQGEFDRDALRIPRKLIQVLFAVVMAQTGAWATVLEDQAAVAVGAFPERAAEIKECLRLARDPRPDQRSVRQLVATLGAWVERLFEQEVVRRVAF